MATTLPLAGKPKSVEAQRPTRRVRVAEAVYQRVNQQTGLPIPGKYEFTYRDATRRQIWQTAKGTTKADAKAERADLVARLRLGHRVERTNLTVAAVARQWVERGIGQHGRWDESTRERYDRIVRRTIEASADPARLTIGTLKLRDLNVDRVAAWSQLNERDDGAHHRQAGVDRPQPGMPLRAAPGLAGRQPGGSP